MKPAAAAAVFDQPMLRIGRRRKRDFGMRNGQRLAEFGKARGLFDARHHRRGISKDAEMLGHLRDEMRPVFESAAIDERRSARDRAPNRANASSALRRRSLAPGPTSAPSPRQGGAYRDRQKNRRRADDNPPAAPPQPWRAPKGRRSEFQAIQTSSRASLNASRKSRHRALSEVAIFLKSPNSVLYLMSPMARAPMPRLPPGNSLP